MPMIPDNLVPALRAQLRRATAAAEHEPIEKERLLQDLTGDMMKPYLRGKVHRETVELAHCQAAALIPRKLRGTGAVLYLHGGGYCCGDLDYAAGFGKVFCTQVGVPTLCPEYRLAPEHPFPAALEDAEDAYLYLLHRHGAGKIVLIGESAGGGLCFSLCQRLRERGLPLPGGIVALSPWTDLTLSGASYTINAQIDPSMTRDRLKKFADCYTSDAAHPLVSPLFGDMTGLPPTLLFVGGDEVMRDDSVQMYAKLLAAGVDARLTVAPEMWHAYLFYALKQRRQDMAALVDFMRGKTL